MKNIFLFLILLFSCLSANANRLAILIGNSEYEQIGRLDNPANDAKLISQKLQDIGFEVQLHQNLTEIDFNKIIKDLSKNSDKYDSTLIYYAGHAVQLDGVNYLLTTNQEPPSTEEDIKLSSVNADDLVNAIRSPLKIVILDACRNNPTVQQTLKTKGRGILSRGLAAPTQTSGGVFVAYATQAGNVASDGKGENSPFAIALSNNIGNPESIDDMFSKVTRDVLDMTNGKQRPFKYASLDDKYCLPGPCEQMVAMNVPIENVEKQKSIKEIIAEDVIKISERILPQFDEWITHNWSDKQLTQYRPASIKYDLETNMASVDERYVDRSKNIFEIFTQDGYDYTVTTNVYHCGQKKYHYKSITDYDADGTVENSYIYDRSTWEVFNVEPGSISESTYSIVCDKKTLLLDALLNIDDSSFEVISEDSSGKFLWSRKNKATFEGKDYYAVQYNYIQPKIDDVTDKAHHGELIIAEASCNARSEATIINVLIFNEQRKVVHQSYRIVPEKITIVPDSAGETLLKIDCD